MAERKAHKRVARKSYAPAETVENNPLHGLTAQQAKFVVLAALPDDDGNWRAHTDAYRLAYPNWKGTSTRQKVYALLTETPKVRSAFDTLRTRYLAQIAEESKGGLSVKAQRLIEKQDRHNKLKTIIKERGESPDMANVPGGRTGLLVKTVKQVGVGREAQIVEEWSLDTGLLVSADRIEADIAKELGQIKEIRQMISVSSPLSSYENSLKKKASEELARRGIRPAQKFDQYQTDLVGYSRQVLGVEPWSGRNEPGQFELFNDISESVRMQLAGEKASKIFRVEAGHGVGKTFGGAIIVNWFFDAFKPSIALTTAPTKEQVEDLLWKNIKKIRPSSLPGRVLPGSPRMEKAADHFAYGRTTTDSGGKGTERFQGQHDEYLLFLLDEAEGIADYVFDAVDAMMTGGKVILAVMLANPRTRSSRFHKLRYRPRVNNYRLSALNHPNVIDGEDTVPGATSRDWVEDKIVRWCEPVQEQNADDHTFTVPYPVQTESGALPPGTIFKPNAEFCFRVIGVAPENLTGNTFISAGRYEAAQKNAPLSNQEDSARLGLDVARFGDDLGALYCRTAGAVRKVASFAQEDTKGYLRKICEELRRLCSAGVRNVHIRVDGTGGFGSGIIDGLNDNEPIKALFAEFKVIEVQFGSNAHNQEAYDNIVTEMYAEAAESLKGLRLVNPPPELEGDLTERQFAYVNRSGKEVKTLEPKPKFKARLRRSPDDGDGFVLAVAPDHIFKEGEFTPESIDPVNQAAYDYEPGYSEYVPLDY